MIARHQRWRRRGYYGLLNSTTQRGLSSQPCDSTFHDNGSAYRRLSFLTSTKPLIHGGICSHCQPLSVPLAPFGPSSISNHQHRPINIKLSMADSSSLFIRRSDHTIQIPPPSLTGLAYRSAQPPTTTDSSVSMPHPNPGGLAETQPNPLHFD